MLNLRQQKPQFYCTGSIGWLYKKVRSFWIINKLYWIPANEAIFLNQIFKFERKRRTRIVSVCITYSMSDLIYDVINNCVSSFSIGIIGKITDAIFCCAERTGRSWVNSRLVSGHCSLSQPSALPGTFAPWTSVLHSRQLLWFIAEETIIAVFLQMIDSSGADMLRKLVPGCRRVDVVDKCGHAIALDQPKQVADLLLDFHRTSALTIWTVHRLFARRLDLFDRNFLYALLLMLLPLFMLTYDTINNLASVWLHGSTESIMHIECLFHYLCNHLQLTSSWCENI